MDKSPGDVKDYKFDWSDWLEPGETISSIHSVSAGTLTLVGSATITDNGRSVTVWLSGGTLGTRTSVTVSIYTTISGKSDSKTMEFTIKNCTQ